MEYTTSTGDRAGEAHVNYKCPCGCDAGLVYDRAEGPEHLGMCCCGRLMWVGPQAAAVVRSHFANDVDYEIELGSVTLPWGEAAVVALAVPADAAHGSHADHQHEEHHDH